MQILGHKARKSIERNLAKAQENLNRAITIAQANGWPKAIGTVRHSLDGVTLDVRESWDHVTKGGSSWVHTAIYSPRWAALEDDR